jgi:hypothetical protein
MFYDKERNRCHYDPALQGNDLNPFRLTSRIDSISQYINDSLEIVTHGQVNFAVGTVEIVLWLLHGDFICVSTDSTISNKHVELSCATLTSPFLDFRVTSKLFK